LTRMGTTSRPAAIPATASGTGIGPTRIVTGAFLYGLARSATRAHYAGRLWNRYTGLSSNARDWHGGYKG
jgi:hypothetical protein